MKKMFMQLFCIVMLFGISGCGNEEIVDNPSNEKEKVKIEQINGSATAYFQVPISAHASYPTYHTIHFYDDLTCEVENFKQLVTSDSSWAPDDPDAVWSYKTDYVYGPCHYVISNSSNLLYQITVFTTYAEIGSDDTDEIMYIFFADLYETGEINYLQTVLSEKNIKYYFTYKDGKDFGSAESIQREKDANILKSKMALYVGTWKNRYTEFVVKQDGTCSYAFKKFNMYKEHVDTEYVTDCAWSVYVNSETMTVIYNDKYGKTEWNYSLSNNNKTLTRDSYANDEWDIFTKK